MDKSTNVMAASTNMGASIYTDENDISIVIKLLILNSLDIDQHHS